MKPSPDSAALSLFARAARAASFAVSPAKAAAFKRDQEERVNQERADRARETLRDAASRGDAEGFAKALRLFAQFDTLERLASRADTPMELACRAKRGSVEMIAALIERQPAAARDIMVVSHMGCVTPIMLCAHIGNWVGAAALARVVPKNDLDGELLRSVVCALSARYESYPLGADGQRSAASAEGWEQASALLDLFGPGALSLPDRYEGTPGHRRQEPCWMYLALPHYPLMRWALSMGAGVNQRAAGGDMPIHKAAKAFDALCCERLIQMGADVHALDRNGESPLKALGRQAQESISSNSGWGREGDATRARALSVARALVKAGGDPQDLLEFSALGGEWLSQLGAAGAFGEARALERPASLEGKLSSPSPLARVKTRATGRPA